MSRGSAITVWGVLVFVGACIFLLLRPERDHNEPVASGADREGESGAASPSAIPTKPPLTADERIADLYTKPIDFFGRVVDIETGEPVPGANVKARVMIEHSFPPTMEDYQLVCDQNGEFSVLGKRGGAIFVIVSADGHARSRDKTRPSSATYSSNRRFGERFASDTSVANPAVFGLRRQRIVDEALIGRIARRQVAFEEREAGDRIEIFGDFGVTVEHTSDFDPKNPRNGWPWRARLVFVNGGICARPSPDSFVAPRSGYRQLVTYETERPTDPRKWRSKLSDDSFFKTDNGVYGVLRWSLRGRDGTFVIKGWYNVSGSNELEISDY